MGVSAHQSRLHQSGVSKGVLETARSLAVDLVTAEVVSAFRERGVPSILLKGPSIAIWLYRDGAPRPYGDSDLLVPPAQAAHAQQVLLSLGFRYGYESLGPGVLADDLFWIRGRDTVDLHSTLHGVRADPERVWRVLSEHTEVQKVAGQGINVLDPTARAMHVALHAAHHGRREAVPMTDLARALELLPFAAWAQAGELATEIDAGAAFATGLSLLPAGQAIVERLGMEQDGSVNALLSAHTAPTVAFTLEELRKTAGPAAKARFVVRKAFPTRTYMRVYWPIARRGSAGLVVAYCQRIVHKMGKLLPAIIAWRRARRASR